MFVNEGELFGGIGGSARSVAIHLQSSDTDCAERQPPSTAASCWSRPLRAPTCSRSRMPTCRRSNCAHSRTIVALPKSAGTAPRLGPIVRTLGDGAWLGEYFDGQSRLPIILRANVGETPEDLAQAPLITPSGEIVSLGELVHLRNRAGARADPPHRSQSHGHADDRSAADAVARRHAGEDR